MLEGAFFLLLKYVSHDKSIQKSVVLLTVVVELIFDRKVFHCLTALDKGIELISDEYYKENLLLEPFIHIGYPRTADTRVRMAMHKKNLPAKEKTENQKIKKPKKLDSAEQIENLPFR